MATPNSLDLTQTIGPCGRFQIILTVAVNSAYVTSAWGMMFMVFGLYNPGWTCMDADLFNASHSTNPINTSNLYPDSTPSPVSDIEHVTRVWSTDCNVKENCQNLMYNPESSTVVTEWQLSCKRSWIPPVIITILMIGTLVGAYIAGQIGDKFGRKLSFYSSVATYAVGHLIASLVSSWQVYSVFLFVLGAGAGGIFASYFHYPLEFLSTWWRGILPSIPFWNTGCGLFAAVVFALKDWRYVHGTGATLAALVCLTAFWTPESVRWLSVSGKVDKAKEVVSKIAKMNGIPYPDTQIIDDIAAKEKAQMGGHKYNYLDLFRFRLVRGYSIKFAIIWIVMAFSFYVMNFGIKSLSGNFYLNLFIFSVLDFPAVLLVAPTVIKLGRKWTALVFFGLTAAASLSVVCVFFVGSGSLKNVSILVLTLVCKTVILGSWYVVRVFSSELYPTVMRSLHYGYLNSVARIGAMVSPYILSNEPSTLYVPFLTVGTLNLVICGIICTLPETKGRALQDTADVEEVEMKQPTCSRDGE